MNTFEEKLEKLIDAFDENLTISDGEEIYDIAKGELQTSILSLISEEINEKVIGENERLLPEEEMESHEWDAIANKNALRTRQREALKNLLGMEEEGKK